MMHAAYWCVAVVVAVGVMLLLGRCQLATWTGGRIGWHGVTYYERAKKDNGLDDPYKLNWRCARCFRVIGHTEARPTVALKKQIHRARKDLAAKTAAVAPVAASGVRVLDMWGRKQA